MRLAAPAAPDNDVVSKAEFARLCNVSRGRVTQWITERKLTGAAIVGDGRSARIQVSVARTQLKQNLDPVQRVGANGLPTRLRSSPPASATVVPFKSKDDAVEDQIKAERLEALQRANRKLADEESARTGRYTQTADVELQMGRIASQMISSFDSSLVDLATAVSAKFSLQQRDVLHLMRSEFRAIRARVSASQRAVVAELPELIDCPPDAPPSQS